MLENNFTLKSDRESVVLLEEDGRPIGSMRKGDVHHSATPLHLAFSIFIFNRRGQFLVQRRALHKRTWPGVWSNSCCGHPMPGESLEDAVYRRTAYEIGIKLDTIFSVLPRFQYKAEWDGVWENEVCPVFVAFSDVEPQSNPEEVAECRWADWQKFSQACFDSEGTAFEGYSPWCFMEGRELKRSRRFQNLFSLHTQNQSQTPTFISFQ